MDLKPLIWNWPCVTQGDTYPATNITETLSDTDLARVRIKIRKANATTSSLTLDSNTTGITINDSSAGSWDFTINEIESDTMETLESGIYAYDLETTDSADTVRTEFNGSWQILRQITD